MGEPSDRVLVACVGNVLRGDDGFGLAVAAALEGSLPEQADLIETGIGGLDVIHHLMDGYAALIIVDAIEREATPGTVFVLAPELPDREEPTFEDWQAQLADPHLAEPSRLLRLGRAAGVLPKCVLVVGCQPQSCEEFQPRLTDCVAAAVPRAAREVHQLVARWRAAMDSEPDPYPSPPRRPSFSSWSAFFFWVFAWWGRR